MEDLQNNLSSFLSDENNMKMLQNILGQANQGASQNEEKPATQTPDMSAILNMLGQNNTQPTPPQDTAQNSNIDVNAISNILSSLGQNTSNNTNSNQNNNSSIDMGALSSMLSGIMGGNSGNAGGGNNESSDFMKNVDIGMLMKVKQLMSESNDDKNSNLLKAIKPHLSEGRQGKVENAISMMKMTKLLPLLTESGLLGGKK